MSTYYDYYIGYITEDNKIVPIGPFGADGHAYPVLSRSRSFASDLHEAFYYIGKNNITDELKKMAGVKEDDDLLRSNCLWMPIKELPNGEYIEKGYYLIDDVQQYERDPSEVDVMDVFIDRLSPTAYAEKLKAELMLTHSGKQPDKNTTASDEDMYDDEFNDRPHPATDYMYYAWANYYSPEYEAAVIRNGAAMFEYYKIPKGSELISILIVD